MKGMETISVTPVYSEDPLPVILSVSGLQGLLFFFFLADFSDQLVQHMEQGRN